MIGAVLAAGALGLFMALVLLFVRRTSQSTARDNGGEPEALGMGFAVREGNRAQPNIRRRRRAAAAAAAQESPDVSDDEADLGAAAEHEVAARQTKRDAYEARRAARDAEREALEAAQEAEILRAAEERRRREEEEAAKWMHMFSVEAAGEEALSQEEDKALAVRFVEYICARKTVALDELAAEFGLRSQEVVRRVQDLEVAGSITGVMDDRGKFIFISPQEMRAVADYIRQRGRIAIAELASKSNQFVDLEAKEVVGAAALDLLPVQAEVGA